jgi:hypothetical protein
VSAVRPSRVSRRFIRNSGAGPSVGLVEPVTRGNSFRVSLLVRDAGDDLSLSLVSALGLCTYAFRNTATSSADAGAGFIKTR